MTINVRHNQIIQFSLFSVFIALFYGSYFWGGVEVFTVIEVIIALILLFLEYKRTQTFISPLFFWYGFWLLIIAIARVDLHLYAFNSTWGKDLLNCVTLNTVIFFAVYKFFESINVYVGKINQGGKEKTDKVYFFSMFLLIVGAIAFIANVAACRTIPQLSGNADITRRSFVTTSWFSIVNVSRCAFSLAPYVLLGDFAQDKKRKIIIWSLINAIFAFLTGWRTYIFQIIILFMTTYLILFRDKLIDAEEKYKLNREQKKIIIRLIIIAILLIGVVSVTRANIGFVSIKKFFSLTFGYIYLYFAPSFLNFQTGIHSVQPINNFLYTTEGLWGIIIPESAMPGFKNITFNIGAFNVSTYLLHPYLDYGYVGTYIWTAIIAMIGSIYYKKSLISDSCIIATILGIVNITIFTFHNGFFLRSSSPLLWVLIVWIFSHFSVIFNRNLM